MKLWAYGDSHTAGAELGYSKATLNKFRAIKKRYKHSKNMWNEMLIEKNEYSVVLPPNIACAPEYSWAGQLANLLQADEYICRARPG